MPVKSLESFLFERKLVSSSSIEILQNATIGIDVEHYLSRIYTFKKEQFLSAIGGIPTSLKDYIKSDLKVFNQFNIKPIFVVKGLDVQLQAKNHGVNELSPNEQHLENTWTKLTSRNAHYNYNNNDSFRVFNDPLPLRPMIHDLIKYFIEIGIDFVICPYDASFQLSYMYQEKIIDSIYGSTDLLLTKINKFILGMEFQSKDFRFIDKSKVLYELNLTARQLLDLSLMVGCSLQPMTFPNLPPLPKPNPIQPYPQLSYFKLALDILYQLTALNGDNTTDLYSYTLSLNDQRCLDLYLKGHSAFRYIPILNKEGSVTMYNEEMIKLGLVDPADDSFLLAPPEEEKENGTPVAKKAWSTDKNEKKSRKLQIPNDVHDIISQRLPAEFYFYQSIGLAPLELLEAITQGQLSIRPPLESGLNDSYKNLINSKQFTENLDSMFNLLTQLLARYYQVKKIKVSYWYKADVLELNNRLVPPISRRLNHLFVSEDTENFKLVDFFKSLPEEYPKQEFTGKIVKAGDLVATSMLRALYLQGVIDSNDKLSSHGKAIKKFLLQSPDVDDETLQELILLLLLIKSGCFNLSSLQLDFTGVAKHFKEPSGDGTDTKLEDIELKYVQLISRIFSLHKLQVAPINYQGPISRNLLNFRSHIKFISTNLVYSVQCCLIDLLVKQEKNDIKINLETKDDWYKLVDQLPFFTDVNNTLLGVVAEVYFEYSAKQSKLNPDLTKDQIIDNTKDQLLNVAYQISNPLFNINVHGVNSITSHQFLADLSNGVKFWDKFTQLVKICNETDKLVVSDVNANFVFETDKWMKNYV